MRKLWSFFAIRTPPGTDMATASAHAGAEKPPGTTGGIFAHALLAMGVPSTGRDTIGSTIGDGMSILLVSMLCVWSTRVRSHGWRVLSRLFSWAANATTEKILFVIRRVHERVGRDWCHPHRNADVGAHQETGPVPNHPTGRDAVGPGVETALVLCAGRLIRHARGCARHRVQVPCCARLLRTPVAEPGCSVPRPDRRRFSSTGPRAKGCSCRRAVLCRSSR